MARAAERSSATSAFGGLADAGCTASPTTRRAIARRFSCPSDVAWRRVTECLAGVSAGIAVFGASLHALPPVIAGVTAVLIGASLMFGLARRPSPSTEVLRWDGAAWWWLPSDRRLGAGAPLAVTPQVLIDLEQWMLLRLPPAADELAPAGWSRWALLSSLRTRQRVRFLAVSRRGVGADWSLLRIHLLLARC